MTREQILRVIKVIVLRKAGLSYTKIAKETGLNHGYIPDLLAKLDRIKLAQVRRHCASLFFVISDFPNGAHSKPAKVPKPDRLPQGNFAALKKQCLTP